MKNDKNFINQTYFNQLSILIFGFLNAKLNNKNFFELQVVVLYS